MINQSMLDEFLELVQIPVHSKDERRICDVLKEKLSTLGLDVHEDAPVPDIGGNTGNVIARLKGDSKVPAVLLSAHMDRVGNPGKINPVVDEKGKLIRSDGTSILAADDVSGLCAILDALRRIIRDKTPHGDIEIAFSTCEEIGVQGSKHFNFSEFKAKQAYVVDCPGRIGKIVNQAPAKYKITATVKGIKAHAGNEPEKGLNAIKVAACALAEIPEGRISPAVTSNFGTIQGGNGTNVVCDKCVITGEARGTDEAALEEYLRQVKEVFARTATHFNTEIDVNIKLLYHTFYVDPSDNVIQTLLNAFKTEGIDGFCQKGGGGSDGNHFNWNGIKSVVMGLGYSKNHTNSEQIYYEDMMKCGKVLQDLVHQIYTQNT